MMDWIALVLMNAAQTLIVLILLIVEVLVIQTPNQILETRVKM
jgi:hypothetical protein